jgi:hypothetical protein
MILAGEPDMKHLAAGALVIAALSGCATASASVQADLATAKASLSQAVNAYGVAKGIADVAVAADPALAAPVAQMEAAIDPLIPAAQTLLATSSTDTQEVTQMAQQIQGQIVAIETTTAPKIKVVASN